MPKRKRAKYPKRAPPKASTRTRGHSTRRLAILLVLLILAGTAASFVWYGLSYGAVVQFTFGSGNGIRQTYQLAAMTRLHPSSIDITHILVRNTGNSAITVIVTMHALNAVVSSGYYGPYSDSTGVEMYLPPGVGYRVVNFYLTLPLQASSFTIRVTVGQTIDFSSITSLATSSLASIQPLSPTTLVYTQTPGSLGSYQLTEQY